MGSRVLVGITLKHTVISGLMLSIAVNVVDLTMFYLEGGIGISNRLEGLKVVSGHVVSWLFKDRGFVHVIPGPDIGGGGRVLIVTVLGSPVVSGFFVKEVKVDTSTRPASSNEVFIVLSLNAEVLSNSFLVDRVSVIDLDVRIGNSYKLTTISSKGSV